MTFQRFEHQGGAAPTQLSGNITSSSSSFGIASATGYPTGAVGDFFLVIDPGTASEEKVLCSAQSGGTVTVATRGADGTTAVSHNAGAVVKHCFSAVEADQANYDVWARQNGLFSGHCGSTTSCPGNTTTAVTVDTADVDPAGGVGSGGYTVGVGGTWRVKVSLGTNNSAGQIAADIFVAGSFVKGGPQAATGIAVVDALVVVAKGALITAHLQVVGSGTITVQDSASETWMDCQYVGDAT